MSSRVQTLLTAAALSVAVVALYACTAHFGFVRVDDADYTFGCAFVRGGLTGSGILEALRNVRHGGIWMPLTYLTYMADISLFGAGAFGHHVANLLWHLLNVFLLWGLLRALAGRRLFPAALLLLVIWAVHPQRAEAVAWIAARKELVWSACALAGLNLWARGRLLAALPFALLASAAKPTAMAFPALALAVDLFLKRRPQWRFYVPLVLLALATGALAVFSQTHPEGMAVKNLFYASLPGRLSTAIVAVGLSLAQAVVPLGVHFDYRAVTDALPRGWPVGFAVFLLAAAIFVFRGWRACRRGERVVARPETAAVLWFFAALVPTLGIFGSFGEHARADRFLYVPMMAAPIFAAVWTGADDSRRRRWLCAALGLGVLFAAGLSVPVIASYRDDVALFTRTLRFDPENGRALAHLGEAKCAAGELDGGIGLLRQSAAVRPRVETTGKLAYALMRRGRTSDFAEVRELCAGLTDDPKGQAFEALGTAELVGRDWARAADHLTRSILAPARFYSPEDARLKLGYALHNLGRRNEAMKLFEVAAKSSRRDIATRAIHAIDVVADDPDVMLFW